MSHPDQEPFVTVAGVMLDADRQLLALRAHLDRLVEKHIPQEWREGFVFHAHEFMNGNGKVFDDKKNPYWTEERRFAIADDLASIPKAFDLRVAFGWQKRRA